MRTPVKSITLGAAALLGLSACGKDSPIAPTATADTPSIFITLSTAAVFLERGETGQTVTVYLSRAHFRNVVALAVEGLPSGITATFAPTSLAETDTASMLALRAESTATLREDIMITIRATGAGVATQTAELGIHVVNRAELASMRIVFARWSQDNPFERRRSYLYTMNGDGSGLRQLTEGPFDSTPAVSPDGTRIAFVRDGGLHVMRSDGTGIRRLTTEAGAWTPAWSPDGTKIVFHGSDNSLHIIGADKGGDVRLTTPGPEQGYDMDPAWSPDGRQIVFTRIEQTPSGDPFTTVWIVNSDGTGQSRLGRRELIGFGYRTFASWTPVWSPDGSKIALSGPADDPGGGLRTTIFVMNRDGTGVAEVAYPAGPGWVHIDDWSSDGKWIVFTKAGPGTDIYVLDVNAPRARTRMTRLTIDGRSGEASLFRRVDSSAENAP